MTWKTVKFEWDAEKAETNLKKHGVRFEEAVTVFSDPFSITVPDAEHSISEHRHIDLGMSCKGRLLVVVYTERGVHIRIISSRKVTLSEGKRYEKGIG